MYGDVTARSLTISQIKVVLNCMSYMTIKNKTYLNTPMLIYISTFLQSIPLPGEFNSFLLPSSSFFLSIPSLFFTNHASLVAPQTIFHSLFSSLFPLLCPCSHSAPFFPKTLSRRSVRPPSIPPKLYSQPPSWLSSSPG